MLWFVFAIFGAIFHAFHFAFIKKFLKDIDEYLLIGGVFFATFICLLTASLIKGIPEIGPSFIPALLATAVLNIIGNVLYFKSLRITELSLAVPVLSFSPVFLILTSFVVLRELPSFLGILGIVFITIGSYVLNIEKARQGFFVPFRAFFQKKGMVFMLITAFLFSVSANFDKVLVKNSDQFFGAAATFLFISFPFLVFSIIKKRQTAVSFKNFALKSFLVGAVTALSVVAVNIAYTMQIVPYVISLKRFSVLFTVILGALIFKEKNIPNRFLGAFLMLIGAVIIILF